MDNEEIEPLVANEEGEKETPLRFTPEALQAMVAQENLDTLSVEDLHGLRDKLIKKNQRTINMLQMQGVAWDPQMVIISMRTGAMQETLNFLDPTGKLRAVYEFHFQKIQAEELDKLEKNLPMLKAQAAAAEAQRAGLFVPGNGHPRG